MLMHRLALVVGVGVWGLRRGRVFLRRSQQSDLRRCRPAHAPAEIQRALDAINTLLDSFLSRALTAPQEGVAESLAAVEQNALVEARATVKAIVVHDDAHHQRS